MDIGIWLRDLGLAQYESAFRDNEIDFELLQHLTVEDLKDLGISSVGHRRRILAAIEGLRTPAPAAAAPTPRPEPPQAEGEYRQVAILFADLVRYTTLTQELGAERMHALLDAYFKTVDEIIEGAGGRVDKHIGDCVMGVFGAPRGHGDDAERAVRAALAIRDAAPRLSASLGATIQVHVGVTTGRVVASMVGAGSTSEYAVTGESVNLASRLTDAAGPGEILISDELYRMLEERLVCEPAGTLSLKGIGAPTGAWRLLDLRHGRTMPGRFVGRRAELSQFASIMRACEEDGAGHVVVVRGEAGIGKTRLGEEFASMAGEQGFAVHRGLVLDFGAETGRDAVRSIMRDLLGMAQRAAQDDLAAAVEKAMASGIVPEHCEAHLYDVLSLPVPARLKAVYEAMDDALRQQGRNETIAHVLRWAASQRPRLLIVEDVHWAGRPLMRLLAQIAEAAGALPVVMVISTRVEGDPLDRAWRAMIAGTPLTTFDLSPLKAEEARSICQAVESDAQVIAALVARAEGNPLFLDQLLRHRDRISTTGVPGSIHSLVQAAVDQLSPHDKEAIQAASVIGQRVDPALMAHLAGRSSLDPGTLIEKNLLRPHGGELMFVHALIRDAIYAALLSQTRKALHLKAAEWFRHRDLKLHAEHLSLAGAPDAAAAFLAAAREEMSSYHYETALALADRGLPLARAAEEKAALLILRGEAWHDYGRMDEAEQSFRSALLVAEDARQRCEALIGLAAVERITDELDAALQHLDQAEAEAVSAGLVAERSRIHFLRGNVLFPRGELDRCLEQHQAGLEFARRSQRPDLQAAALGGLGDAEYVRGRMRSARDRLSECVRISREQNLGRIEVANLAQVAHAMVYTGPVPAAYETAAEAINAAMRIGHARAEINARAAATKALFALARFEECLQEIERQKQAVDRLGAARFKQLAFVFEGRVLHALGRIEEALAVQAPGLDFARATGFAFHGPAIASAAAVIESDPVRKRALMAEAEAGIVAGCVGHNQFRVYADGIDVARALGDEAMLVRFIELLDRYPEEERVGWSEFHAARGRALLALMCGDDGADAAQAVRRATTLGERLGMHFWRLPAPA